MSFDASVVDFEAAKQADDEVATTAPVIAPSAGNPGGVVAVTNQMQATGAIVYCRTSGGIPLAELEAEWHRLGLDPDLLPGGRTEDAALRRALLDVKFGARELVRPLAGSAGLALVDESAQNEDLDYVILLRARVVYTPHAPTTVAVDPPDHPRAVALADAFAEHLLKLSNAKISAWIWGILGGHVRTVSLRETGGVYFVPKTTLATWRGMTEAISNVADVKFYEIPAMNSDDAVEAILDAIQAEAEAEINGMAVDLAKTGEEALGKRALATREGTARRVRDKVREYETLLGKQLAGLQSKMDTLDADLSAAMLMASDDSEN